MAYLTLSTTSNSITANCEGLDSSYAYIRYFVWQLYDEDWRRLLDEIDDQMPPGDSSFSATFTGLSADTTYNVLCGIYADPEYQTLFTTLSGSVTTDPPITCYFQYYHNNLYIETDSEELTEGESYSFLRGFSSSEGKVLKKITSNIYNDQRFPSYASTGYFQCESYDFTIRYYTEDLEISSSSVTENSITMQIDTSMEEIENATYYVWTCNETTQYGLNPTFYSLDSGTTYEITLSVKDSSRQEIGLASCSVTTSSAAQSNVKIYVIDPSSLQGEWKTAIPWIYSNGAWHQAIAHIYSNGAWHEG